MFFHVFPICHLSHSSVICSLDLQEGAETQSLVFSIPSFLAKPEGWVDLYVYACSIVIYSLFIYLCIYLFMYLFIYYYFIHLFIYSFIYLFTYLFFFIYLHLFIYLLTFIYLFIYLHLFIYLFSCIYDDI